MQNQVFLRRFRDPIRVPRIVDMVPRIRENRVPRIREIGSLKIHIGYLTFSLKKTLLKHTSIDHMQNDKQPESYTTTSI